jgi:signal transduction histidine kinase
VQAQDEQARGTDILATVAHDLRTPLSVIFMNARSIVDTVQETTTKEAVEDVIRAAARMDRLLTDLLDVARIESGTLRIVKRRHDAGAIVTEVVRSYRPLFADRGLTLQGQRPASAMNAFFDHDRIVQVLSNLLGNAMKFTIEGTVDLSLDHSPGWIEFVVKDTGVGILPEALPHVFERFWQIDSDTRRGLGLGLFICQQIIAAHGGRISVESEFGQGAAFRFALPTD